MVRKVLILYIVMSTVFSSFLYGCSKELPFGNTQETPSLGEENKETPLPTVSPKESPVGNTQETPGLGDENKGTPLPTVSPKPTPSSSPQTGTTSTSNTGTLARRGSGDYLCTNGKDILDANNKPVRITGIAWFGFETPNAIYHGLWSESMEGILNTIADLGFNAMRVPLSVQLVNEWRKGNYPLAEGVNLTTNPNLKGKTTLEILDTSITYCSKIGLKVMLDMHRINNGDQSPLWHDTKYTEKDFVECWKWLATHYKDNDTVIAMDLFNEPHGKPFQAAGAKWDGSTDPDNWKYEAEKVGAEILKINSNLLIVVEGIEAYSKNGDYTSKDKNNYFNTWWGGNLRGVAKYPVNLKDKVVYSPHDYGPSVFKQTWFEGSFSKETLTKDVWEPNWLYIHNKGIAPILIGEWGGRMDGGINQKWMSALASSIAENKLSHFFWCINPNSGDTGGILKDDWKTIDTKKYNLVKPSLWQINGKFIGLDHEVKLGKNGINLGGV